MSRLVCLEPESPGAAWAPFAGARPIAELTAGAWPIWERWAGVLDLTDSVIMGDEVAGFVDARSVPVVPRGPVSGPAIVVRSDFAPAGVVLELDPGTRRLTHDGVTVAWIVAEGEVWNAPDATGAAIEVEGLLLQGAWDVITALEHFLPADCTDFLAQGSTSIPDGCIVLGDPSELIATEAGVEPGVVFDLRHGAVVLSPGVQVRAGTRLEGPLFVGEETMLLGGAIRHSSIGPRCRVHGEVSSSVFLGFANKSHDGFLGHSVLGQWVNLGAGTITSNLKNTYGEIRLDLPGGRAETGRMNLGTLFGDHAKTAIGSLFATGTIVGAGANVLGAPIPRWVRPFAWGADGESLHADGFVQIARRVMPRRQIEVTDEIEASLRAIHARLAK